MKAEQRKQLEQNELVARLTRWWKGDGTKKPSTTTWAIVGVLVLIVVLIFAWRYYSDNALKERSHLWGEIQIAVEDKQLDQIIESHRGTAAARVAKLQLARGWMQDGLSKLGSEILRPNAIESIEKARTAYQEILNDAKDDPLLQREALLAMAKSEEALVGVPKRDNPSEDRGSLDKALELYQRLVNEHKDTVQGKIAGERVADIEKNKQAIVEFYKDLHTALTRKEAPKAPELPPIMPPRPDRFKFDPPSIIPQKPIGPEIKKPDTVSPPPAPVKEPPKVPPPSTKKDETKKDQPKKDQPKKDEPKKEKK